MRHTRSKIEDFAEQAFKGVESKVDFANRRVFLTGEVDDEAVGRFLVGFHMLDATKGPIEIILSSCGGNVNGGFGIYDALHLSANPVTVKVYGEAMSIAMLCLQGGDVRLVSPTSRGMVHDGFQELDGKFSHNELLALGREFVDSNQIYYEVLAARSRLSIDEVRKMCVKESFMSAKQLVDYGLADGIIESKKGTKQWVKKKSKRVSKKKRRTHY